MEIRSQLESVLREMCETNRIRADQLVVFGVSTSEVLGARIGTGGAMEVAEQLWQAIETVRQQVGFHAAFQCCEHLNRALVVERASVNQFALEEVMAVPAQTAGGAMASYAYRNMTDPCLVESIRAHAGVDIGDTLIGMHLRAVAVPFRPTIRQIGQAHLSAAFTRPKYIGGPRACYTIE